MSQGGTSMNLHGNLRSALKPRAVPRRIRSVAVLTDASVPRHLAALLEDELIAVDVVAAPPLQWELWVTTDAYERACALLDAGALSVGELQYLATGELG